MAAVHTGFVWYRCIQVCAVIGGEPQGISSFCCYDTLATDFKNIGLKTRNEESNYV